MKKLTAMLSLLLVLTAFICQPAWAAEGDKKAETESVTVTVDELNDDSVFIKQSTRGTCTLASAAMVIRRAKLLAGDSDWEEATESAVRGSAWLSGSGILWSFTYDDISMTHDYVSGTGDLIELLEEHPEGIVAYDSWMPHAILLTDYDAETDTFYCADPSEYAPYGRIPVSESLISIYDVSTVWYVSDSPEITAPVLSIDEVDADKEADRLAVATE